MSERGWDAVVIGGGPAGATAAAVLAQAGMRTAVLEKRRFPRYRVGESLLPWCFFPLERIGAAEAVRDAGFVNKYSVQFASVSGNMSRPFYFFEVLDHEAARTWQVPRAEFDRILLDNARKAGATVLEDTRARALLGDERRILGVRAVRDGEEMTFRAPVTLDCTGRDALAARAFSWRVVDPELRKVSLWSYYRGGLKARALDAGATTVAMLPEKGWVWHIPLPGGLTSVGVTADAAWLYREGRDPERVFEREVRTNPWIRERLRPATRVQPVQVTGDYSYRSRHCATGGLLLAGDAFAFLDPVFSSGVFLALRSGEMAGDAAVTALRAGDTGPGRFAGYGSELIASIEAMRKLVVAFYDEGFRFADLLEAHPDLRQDLTDCLIGNLTRDFTALQRALAEFARVPEDLPHGMPVPA